MTTFFGYWSLVFRYAWSQWLETVREHFGVAFLYALLAAAVLYFFQRQLISWSPASKDAVGDPMSSIVQFGLGAVCLLVVVLLSFVVFLIRAPSQIHSEQLTALEAARDELRATNKEMASLKDARPKLAGQLITILNGTFVHGETIEKFPFTNIWMAIRNTGEQTAVENMVARLRLPDGREFKGEWVMISPDTSLTWGSRKITQNDVITKKVKDPIPKGGVVHGFFPVVFREITKDEITTSGVIFMVDFSDVFGNQYTAMYDTSDDPGQWESEVPKGTAIYLPGE